MAIINLPFFYILGKVISVEKEDLIEIDELFLTIIKIVDLMLGSDFYTEKQAILEIKRNIENWYANFKVKDSLLSISVENLKNLDLEITEIFSKYIEIESAIKNYSEVLSYYFNKLKRYWKDELLKSNI